MILSHSEEQIRQQDLRFLMESLAKENNVFFIPILGEFLDAIRWGDDTLHGICTVVQSLFVWNSISYPLI